MISQICHSARSDWGGVWWFDGAAGLFKFPAPGLRGPLRRKFPVERCGLRVDRKCGAAAFFSTPAPTPSPGVPDATCVGEYRIHYADGVNRERFPFGSVGKFSELVDASKRIRRFRPARMERAATRFARANTPAPGHAPLPLHMDPIRVPIYPLQTLDFQLRDDARRALSASRQHRNGRGYSVALMPVGPTWPP